jgi:long-subunit fatty acid transport protein
MKRNIKVLAVMLAVSMVLSSLYLNAQSRWSFELKPGMNYATRELGTSDIQAGFSFEGVFAYRCMPHLSVYAGWGWNKFSADQSNAGSNIDFEETGYTFGLQFVHPFSEKSQVSYMIKAGGLYNHIETENSDGEIIYDTGHGLGWQLGGGIAVPIGKRWTLIPEIRFRSLSRTAKFGETSIPMNLNYISGGIGVSFAF